MAAIPLKNITGLYNECRRRLKWYKDTNMYNGKGSCTERKGEYMLWMSEKGEIVLYHYGTIIWEYKPGKPFSIGGAYSRSDMDAIRTMNFLTKKGKDVYIQNGAMYMVGKGPRYKKKTGPKTNAFGLTRL